MTSHVELVLLYLRPPEEALFWLAVEIMFLELLQSLFGVLDTTSILVKMKMTSMLHVNDDPSFGYLFRSLLIFYDEISMESMCFRRSSLPLFVLIMDCVAIKAA